MKLIGSWTSPYARKVRMVLAEKKIEYEFVLDSPWTPENRIAEFNPLGKIPVLLLDEETALFDSRVIVEYLDNVAPNNKLMPVQNRERTEVKRWEALADGICDAGVAIVLEKRRPPELQSSAWIARQEAKINAGLSFIAGQIGEENSWCIGTHFSLADICTGCALGFLAFRFPAMDWREQHPALARLYEKLMLRPSFAESIPHD
ncbi:MAG: glutathione S-transferase [Pseudomonadota bacterium]